MKRVTGIGGIFFKSTDPQRLKEWYRDHLGFTITEWGATFIWGDSDEKKKTWSRTEWSPFKDDSDYYKPSNKPYMINYRVENLEWLIETLKGEGVTIVGDIGQYEYGKFGWIMDPEGTKIELWEPVDDKFGDNPSIWKERVTGVGGVFFKSVDPKTLTAWYLNHLGVGAGPFRWHDLNMPDAKVQAHSTWAPFSNDTSYFSPSEKLLMLNYRVKDLDLLLKILQEEKVEVVGTTEEYPYGKFGWIMDPEGNKVELWEPKDDGY